MEGVLFKGVLSGGGFVCASSVLHWPREAE